MITGEGANARVHLMRAHADAVMVGIWHGACGRSAPDRAAAGPRAPLAGSRRPRQPPAHAADRASRRQRARDPDLDRRDRRQRRPRAERALVERGVEVHAGRSRRRRPVDLADAMRLLGDARAHARASARADRNSPRRSRVAGLVDEVCLVTATVTSGGGRPGPAARTVCGTLGALRASGEEAVGADRFDFYERP